VNVAKLGVEAAAGTCVVFPRSLNAVCAASPREHAAKTARKTVPTAMALRKASLKAFRIGLPKARPLSELSSFT
jgi:hypothetical protein